MAAQPSYRTESVRAALDAIVSDPEHGPSVLYRPQDLANLLSDYLPDCPKESGLLLAAASAGLSAVITDYLQQGMDPVTAVHMAAVSLADRAAFTAEACQWVTAEIGRALGLELAASEMYPLPDTPAGELTQSAVRVRPQPVPSSPRDPASSPGPGVTSAIGRPRRRRTTIAGAVALVLVVGAVVIALRYHDQARATALRVPAPDLARLVPADQRVLKVVHVDLVAGQAPEVAVTTTTPASGSAQPSEDMLLLAWDTYARRWSVVYNATRDQVMFSAEPDAYTDSFQAVSPPTPQPLILPKLGVLGIRLKQVRDQRGGAADLLITASVLYADGYASNIGILHYDGKVARVAWAFIARGGAASAIGAPGHQEIAVTSEWATPADPQCCPARAYRFVLAKGKEPQIGEIYRVISDNRPWMGAIIADEPYQSPEAAAVVVSVVPGSPAAGILRKGDILVGISGSSATSHGLGPAIFDQLAPARPGQTVSVLVDRDASEITVSLKLGSLASPKAIKAGEDLPMPNGTKGRYML